MLLPHQPSHFFFFNDPATTEIYTLSLHDALPIHQGEPIEKLRARHPRPYVEHFPSYSPELNPEEGVWSLSKKELANGCPKDIDELMESIIRVIDGIRRSPAKLRWSILQSELPLFLR